MSTYIYDLNGNLLSHTDPVGARREATYDYMGRRLTATAVERDPAAAHTTAFTYHPSGWLAAVTPPGRASTTYAYNGVGEQIQATDGVGNASVAAYDFTGRPTDTQMPDGTKQIVGYDAAGYPNVRRLLNAAGTTVAQTSATYDGAGRVLTSTDARGTTKTFNHNLRGQVIGLVEPISASESITTTFGYDAAGNSTRMTDGRGNRFLTTYNAWNLPESQVEPGGHTFTMAYDIAGRAVASHAPGAVAVNNSYDPVGRLIGQTGSGADAASANRSYGYDLAGRLRTVTEGQNTTTLSYNDRGLLASAAGAAGASSFTYAPDGRPLTRQDASGTSTYTYDAIGRTNTITDASTGELLTYTYNSLSQVSSVSYGTTANTRLFTYDERHLPDTDELRTPAQQTIAKIDYGFDPNGNEISKTTIGFAGAATNTYTYDLANRLTSWDDGTAVTGYQYDKSGNRTGVGTRTFTYNERNQLTFDGETTYTYTPRGTLSGATIGTVTTPSTFDAYGQQGSQGGQSYTYDGLGRVLTSASGAMLRYSGLGNDPAADGTSTYSRAPDGTLIGVKAGGVGVFALLDLHGDQVGQFTSTGTSLAGSRSYDPLGRPSAGSGITGQIGYQSGWTDPATAQVNMHSRWYNPGTAQFAARDTLTVSPLPDTIHANRYAYGDGNPLTTVDPTGHEGQNWSAYTTGMLNWGIGLINNLIDWAARVGSRVVDDLVQVRDTAIDLLARFKTWVVEQAQQAAEFARQQAARAADWARQKAEAAEVLAERAAASARKMVDGVTRFAEDGAQAIADAYKQVETWVKEHKAEIAGFVVSAVVAVGCGIAIGWTGVGAIVCAVIASAAGSYITGVMQGKTGWELATDVVTGSLTGLIGGPLGGKAVGALVKASGGTRLLAGLAKNVAGKQATGLHTLKGSATRFTGGARGIASSPASRTASGAAGRGRNAVNKPDCHSFDPATPVLMADRSVKPIRDVEVGERVLATDPATGESTARPVTQLHRNIDRDLAEVTVKDDTTGNVSVLKTTWNHPFWNASTHAWINAADLKPGTRLRDDEGKETQQVVAVRTFTGLAEMRDLTIDEIHTYYVMAADTPVLVHNCGGARFEVDSAGTTTDRANTVYRVLRPEEDPSVGLFAKDPNANWDIGEHVAVGSTPGFRSQFISTTRSLEIAQRWAAKSGNRIAEINLEVVNGAVYDLTTPQARQFYLLTAKARGYAMKSEEVIIHGMVPPSAIVSVFSYGK